MKTDTVNLFTIEWGSDGFRIWNLDSQKIYVFNRKKFELRIYNRYMSVSHSAYTFNE